MMSSVTVLQCRLVQYHPASVLLLSSMICLFLWGDPLSFASQFWCPLDCTDCSGKILVVMAPWSNGGHIAAFCPEWIYSAKQCRGFRLLSSYPLYSTVFVLEYRMCNHLYQCVIKWYRSFLEDLGGTSCKRFVTKQQHMLWKCWHSPVIQLVCIICVA